MTTEATPYRRVVGPPITPATNRKATTAVSFPVVSVGSRRTKHDKVVTEEPMEIRLAGPDSDAQQVAVTMRTPGHDFELAVGFLCTEGLLPLNGEVRAVRYCELPEDGIQQFNVVSVRISTEVGDAATRRALLTSSSCGICGTASLDQISLVVPDRTSTEDSSLSAEVLIDLPQRLRKAQAVFDRTGGLHAAALFRPDGSLIVLREDVGRHNAVDKVIGHMALQNKRVLGQTVLFVSGRTSFEIIQKAAMAQISIIAAVSAPSSLAIDAADRFGITLAGFVRDGHANVYTHAQRILDNSI
jgi:FdhD protein